MSAEDYCVTGPKGPICIVQGNVVHQAEAGPDWHFDVMESKTCVKLWADH